MTYDERHVSLRDFTRVYTEYHEYLVRLAVSYVRDKDTAEDLVSDAFLKVLETYDSKYNVAIQAYLFLILKRCCINWLKRETIHNNAHKMLQEHNSLVEAERLSSLDKEEKQIMMTIEALEILQGELERMPAKRRNVFLAKRFEDMSYDDIAQIYNLTKGQVKYELHAATEALKVALKDYLPLIGFMLGLYR